VNGRKMETSTYCGEKPAVNGGQASLVGLNLETAIKVTEDMFWISFEPLAGCAALCMCLHSTSPCCNSLGRTPPTPKVHLEAVSREVREFCDLIEMPAVVSTF
jgi:hypothetical protein